MESIIKFKNKTWKLSITRDMSFFHACLAVNGYHDSSFKFGVPIKDEIYITYEGVHSTAFFCEDQMPRYLESIYDISINPKKLKRLENAYKKIGTALLFASKRLVQDPDISNYDNFIKAYLDLCPGLSLTSVFGRYTNEILKKRLEKIFPDKNDAQIDTFIASATYPSGHTPLLQSQIVLLTFAASLQKRKIHYSDFSKYNFINTFIKSYLEEFGVIPVNFNNEPLSHRDVARQLKGLLEHDCKKELNNIRSNHKDKIIGRRRALLMIKDKKLKHIAISTGVATSLNEYRKFIFCRASLAYRPLFKKAARKYGLTDWRIFWRLTPHEFGNLYFHNVREILKFLTQRKMAGVTTGGQYGYRVLTNSELNSILARIKKAARRSRKSYATRTNGLKGVIANVGYIRGKAKIILSKKDFSKFQRGDVLVAPMTSVDYIPLMRMAGAFVTDEGGLTSHAAIISREMGKPCIIGTKIATRVFKNGDRVEVDADKGIVRKL